MPESASPALRSRGGDEQIRWDRRWRSGGRARPPLASPATTVLTSTGRPRASPPGVVPGKQAAADPPRHALDRRHGPRVEASSPSSARSPGRRVDQEPARRPRPPWPCRLEGPTSELLRRLAEIQVNGTTKRFGDAGASISSSRRSSVEIGSTRFPERDSGMQVESDDGSPRASRERRLDHAAMAEVNAVERAEKRDGARLLQLVEAGTQPHRRHEHVGGQDSGRVGVFPR